MITSITRIVAKGLQNNVVTSNKHTFWLANFNMPVENMFVDTSNWIRYNGCVNHLSSATSFNIGTDISPGLELVVFSAIWDWENNGGSPVTVDDYLYSKWVDTDNSTVLFWGANGYHFVQTINPGYWFEYMWCVHIGIAGWEIDVDGDYYVKASATGNYPISEVSTTITFINVPDTTQLTSAKNGYIWVEGNNLCFINADRWKHTMVGASVSTTPGISKAGHIWIDTNNDLHWVGGNGYDYKASWKIKQFASTFGNSCPSEVYAGTSKAGFIWVDNLFGLTHLAYIGYDGYEYLIGAGVDPYA